MKKKIKMIRVNLEIFKGSIFMLAMNMFYHFCVIPWLKSIVSNSKKNIQKNDAVNPWKRKKTKKKKTTHPNKIIQNYKEICFQTRNNFSRILSCIVVCSSVFAAVTVILPFLMDFHFCESSSQR